MQLHRCPVNDPGTVACAELIWNKPISTSAGSQHRPGVWSGKRTCDQGGFAPPPHSLKNQQGKWALGLSCRQCTAATQRALRPAPQTFGSAVLEPVTRLWNFRWSGNWLSHSFKWTGMRESRSSTGVKIVCPRINDLAGALLQRWPRFYSGWLRKPQCASSHDLYASVLHALLAPSM